MNFLINTYYIFLRKHEAKGIEASIYGLTFPLTLNLIVLLTLILYLFRILIYQIALLNFMSTSLIAVVFFFGINKYLENRYLKNKAFVDLYLPKIYYLFAPLHYLISVILFVICLRFS